MSNHLPAMKTENLVVEPINTQPENQPDSQHEVHSANLTKSGARNGLLRFLARPATFFWIAFLLIMISGTALRTIRIDMPPVDFPADRQKSNSQTIDSYIRGAGLLDLHKQWMEIPLYPWIVAKTWWVGKRITTDTWTWARGWAIFFGMVTVALAGLAGYWGSAVPGSTHTRRLRLALLFMAAVGFNTYHIRISRMITTESLTLACQAAALVFFLIGQQRPHKIRYHVLFILFFILSGVGKIPSLIWLPGYMLVFAFNRQIQIRTRLITLGFLLAATLVVFWVYRLAPTTVIQSYIAKYPRFFEESFGWMKSEIWLRGYFGRTVLMLTLPGAIFAVIGFLVAPWLFRITTVCFLVLFYFLLNLNTYNYCHIILPGMALAAWGMNMFFELTRHEYLNLVRRRTEETSLWQRWANQLAGAALGGLIICCFYPMGPNKKIKPEPQSDILQAVEVIKKEVPRAAEVVNSDGQAVLSYLLKREAGKKKAPISKKLDLSSGYYYSLKRFDDETFGDAAAAWVQWASLPGEFNGILYSRRPQTIQLPQLDQYFALGKSADAPEEPFEMATLYLPKDNFNTGGQILTVAPGSTVRFGVQWNNQAGAPLAGFAWQNLAWRQTLPVPVRQGGFAIQRGGVLCIPRGIAAPALYMLEIPAQLPEGIYALFYYPLQQDKWNEKPKKVIPVPFHIVVRAENTTPSERTERKYYKLYPTSHDRSPALWTDSWLYKNMELEGYILSNSVAHFLACPGNQPGLYQITIKGSSVPITDPVKPGYLWGTVDVFLPEDLEHPVASLPMAAEKPTEFRAQFMARQPFNNVMLRVQIKGATGGKIPTWLTNFEPESYGRLGQQYVHLRSVRLTRKGEATPAKVTALSR